MDVKTGVVYKPTNPDYDEMRRIVLHVDTQKRVTYICFCLTDPEWFQIKRISHERFVKGTVEDDAT